MELIAADLLDTLPDAGQVKFLLNDAVLAFFPASWQHRDFKVAAASYADDSQGNALAGIVSPDRVEIRLHRNFSAQRVAQLWDKAVQLPGARSVAQLPIRYGNEFLKP